MKFRRPRLGVFSGTVLLFASIVFFLVVVFPRLAQWATDYPVPLPIPRTLLMWWMLILVASFATYILSHTETTRDFVAPINAAVRGESSAWARWLARILALTLPLALGVWAFSSALPRTTPPTVTRQQHPGTAGPSATPFNGLVNPYREEASPEVQEATLTAGRDLYFTNCAPCHGAKYEGEGPAATALGLLPVNFRDPGTIATLVEDAVLWRISEGWSGLPPVSTPWESAMPAWGDELTQDQMWQLIYALYTDASVEPRIVGMQ